MFFKARNKSQKLHPNYKNTLNLQFLQRRCPSFHRNISSTLAFVKRTKLRAFTSPAINPATHDRTQFPLLRKFKHNAINKSRISSYSEALILKGWADKYLMQFHGNGEGR